MCTRAASRAYDATAQGLPALCLFTGVEGSTRLWQDHPTAMRSIMARDDTLIESAIVDQWALLLSPSSTT